MPTEEEMRANPGKEWIVKNTRIWFESYDHGDFFIAAPADTGDAGDAFETYEQMIESIE